MHVDCLLHGGRLFGAHRPRLWVKALCVPGSGQVKRAAEAGVGRHFPQCRFRVAGTGLFDVLFAGGESFGKGVRVASTTNRNFEGRQGWVSGHIASPLTVASACAGHRWRTQRHDALHSARGVALPLLRDNIDTDAIIPSREMRTVSRSGLAAGLFAPGVTETRMPAHPIPSSC